MIGIDERQRDILKLIENVDISPSMYENAVKKYKALADYLNRHTDLNMNMYAQGSFAFGTVVRPVKEGKDAAYDLDFICEVDRDRGEISASELRSMIEKAISDCELYGGKMEISDECITIHYAVENDVGFSIDIVPAVHESYENINRLRLKAECPDLIGTSISIPMGTRTKGYVWHTNNPKGFQTWFEEINKPFLDHSRTAYRKALFESSGFYNTVEDIPFGMERSAVQRVIQILKRNRDLFYHNFPDLKPISAIINVLVTNIASECNADIGIFDLLGHVMDELSESTRGYKAKTNREIILESRIVGRRNNGWYIANPANPEDNLASRWNEDSRIPAKFFLWAEAAQKDLIDSMEKRDDEFGAIMESSFGQDAVQRVLGDKYCSEKATPIINAAKPWRRF